MKEKIELHAIVTGKVQGVFFRRATKNHAEELGVVGTVQNLRDGSVEIYAQGTQSQLEAFLSQVEKEPGFGKVDQIDVNYQNIFREMTCFHIL